MMNSTRGNSPMQIILPSTPMSGRQSQSRSRSRSKSIQRGSKTYTKPLNENVNYANKATPTLQPRNRYRTQKYLASLKQNQPKTDRQIHKSPLAAPSKPSQNPSPQSKPSPLRGKITQNLLKKPNKTSIRPPNTRFALP